MDWSQYRSWTGEQKQYWTVGEVAQLLRVRPATVRARLKAGRLGGFRFGRAWRIPATALLALVDES